MLNVCWIIITFYDGVRIYVTKYLAGIHLQKLFFFLKTDNLA